MGTTLVPPENLDAENAVLGCAMLEPNLAGLASVIQPDDFYLDAHRILWRAMVALYATGAGVDAVTVASYLRDRGELQGVGGAAKIAQLVEAAAIATHARSYADLILDAATKRDLLALAHDLAGKAQNGARAVQIVENIGERLDAIRKRRRADDLPVVRSMRQLLAEEFQEKPHIVGDGVLVPGGLVVVGGDPKVGKSALVMNVVMARSVGLPVIGLPTSPGRTLYMNAEIVDRELQSRVRNMLLGFGAEADRDEVQEQTLFCTKRGINLAEHAGMETLDRLVEKFRPDTVVIDPKAKFDAGTEDTKDTARFVDALGLFRERYDVAVILVHHTTKPTLVQRQGGQRLRGGGGLAADADSILILDRTDDGYRLTFDLRYGRDREPLPLSRSRDSLWFSVAEPPGPPVELLAVASVVASVPLRYATLVGAIEKDRKVSTSTAERLIRQAKKAGLIEQDAEKSYLATVKYRQNVGDGSGSYGD